MAPITTIDLTLGLLRGAIVYAHVSVVVDQPLCLIFHILLLNSALRIDKGSYSQRVIWGAYMLLIIIMCRLL